MANKFALSIGVSIPVHWGTGCVALRAERKLGPVNATANTFDGIRLSSRVPLKGRLIEERLFYVTSQFLNHPSKHSKSVYNCL